MKRLETKTISIIGGGASGVAVIVALIKEFKENPPLKHKKIQINVFEPGPLGRGLAYGDFDNRFLLNTSVCLTTLKNSERLDLYNWLKKNESLWRKKYPEIKKYTDESFIPRSLVGLYIEDTLKTELASFKGKQIQVKQISEFANDIEYHQNEKQMTIITQREKYLSDYCILTTGYGDGLPSNYTHLLGSPHYYPSPYLFADQIKKIPKNKRVLILGTGLSAIDSARILEDCDCVVMGSRHGRLPAVRNRFKEIPPKYLTEMHQKRTLKRGCTIEMVKREIEKELNLVYNKEIELEHLTVLPDPAEQLKVDIEMAKTRKNIWEDSLMSIIIYLTNAWRYLSIKEKKTFYHKYTRLVQRYISPFPYINAAPIYKALEAGKLSIRKGIKEVDKEGNRFKAFFVEEDREVAEYFDYVINATAVLGTIRKPDDLLHRNLLKKGIIQENAFGGIKVGSKFEVKNEQFKEHRFYAEGPNTTGTIPFTNLLLSSAQSAEIIARDLIKKL